MAVENGYVLPTYGKTQKIGPRKEGFAFRTAKTA